MIKGLTASLMTMPYQLMQHLVEHCHNKQFLFFHKYFKFLNLSTCKLMKEKLQEIVNNVQREMR